jgi:hypothetical protein
MWNVWARTGSIWLRIGTGGGLLWMRFHKMGGNFLISWRPVNFPRRPLFLWVGATGTRHNGYFRFVVTREAVSFVLNFLRHVGKTDKTMRHHNRAMIC